LENLIKGCRSVSQSNKCERSKKRADENSTDDESSWKPREAARGLEAIIIIRQERPRTSRACMFNIKPTVLLALKRKSIFAS